MELVNHYLVNLAQDRPSEVGLARHCESAVEERIRPLTREIFRVKQRDLTAAVVHDLATGVVAEEVRLLVSAVPSRRRHPAAPLSKKTRTFYVKNAYILTIDASTLDILEAGIFAFSSSFSTLLIALVIFAFCSFLRLPPFTTSRNTAGSAVISLV